MRSPHPRRKHGGAIRAAICEGTESGGAFEAAIDFRAAMAAELARRAADVFAPVDEAVTPY